ncbi:MAG TPA: hypothetical protein VNF51_03245 [Candidatus Paceibacterota bacterium]|nr:hypothetical protein [Candidatus Paceibacterota bacterium]
MNIFGTIGFFLKRLRTSALQDPVRDWLVLLTLSSIALAGIIVWNVWMFDTIANGGVIGVPASSAPPLFNSASLDAIHTIFVNRAAEQTKYVTGFYRYVDPSQ